MSIYYVDEVMGRGKSTAIINYINSAEEYKRFLVIVPYLTEVDRMTEACSGKGFCTPSAEGGKLRNIKRLIAENKNIVSTHALFTSFDDELMDMIKAKSYTLVLDEVPIAISPYNISTYDAAIIINRHFVEIEEDGRLRWTETEYHGAYSCHRQAIQNGFIYAYTKSRWICMLPRRLYTIFEDIYILTYLFQDQFQRCYFDLEGIQYQRKYVAGNSPETYRISDEYEAGPISDFRPLINILDNPKMNEIGEGRTDLSKSWYVRNSKRYEQTEPMKRLRNNVSNFFVNITKTKSKFNLWTTFCEDDEHEIDWQKMLSAGGYSKGFLSCNARGTNGFRHKTSLAYLVNVFPNTSVRNYLVRCGIEMDQDRYALSEMIQWIWRSAIRDGREINLYIPSKRMRTLLINWLNDVASGSQYQQEARSCS